MTDRRHVTPTRTAGGWNEEAALATSADTLGLTVADEILDGGSPARVYRTTAATGDDLVLKVLVPAPGAVDGHDLASFRHKLHQIERLRTLAPRLAAHYLPVVHFLDGDGWSACTTPFYDSADLAAPLRESPPRTGEFFRRHATLVRALVLDGYAVCSHPTPVGHLEEVVVGRFLRRLPVLRRALPEDLTTAPRITVNGVPCEAPHLALGRLTGRLAPLAPARLMAPAHGDANTRNVLWCTRPEAAEEFRLIDPRGSVEPWDPVYDLAKTLFSLSVWDPALRTGFSVHGSKHGYEVGFRQPVFPGYRAAVHRFLPHLATHEGLSFLFRDDPGWLDRLLLTHALHVLAEAPCRLSDRKPKPDLQGRESTPEALALGHYLLGTLLINDLVDRLDRVGHVDAAGHLALVTDHLPGGGS
ncbi:hypothetical protein [Kitasatospora sp. A2-31]|uniref:hypothetical protein n=1 Tax=Kitasatospora sp. A2-31 TaxID=2916414 RepID=UPI001EEBE352|nr:hypothetical protein [Kitasatospora sp. A2-31]MCG6494298.1 hypothetical protein [Kitasatospora sp. A2-31]